MSVLPSPVLGATAAVSSKERGHLMRIRAAGVSALLFILGLAVYGADYYTLPMEQRPYSPKHAQLRPGGAIGIRLGILGVALFCFIFLYALRKAIPWLGRIGTARHWMDFHAIAGITAPVVIAFHASFKFRGLAGIAFWIMLAVALSGIVGRYLYAQIPRSLNAAELSLSELRESEEELTRALLTQSVYSHRQLARVLDIPSPEQTRQTAALVALAKMIVLDLRRPLQIAALRRASCHGWQAFHSLGGFLATGNNEVERVVHIVRQKASLSKRIVFLDHTHSVFHLWHVVHRPFSYSFAVLAIIHIVVVTGFGFL